MHILNADEQIYMRYGGRDAKSDDIYLSLDSMEIALSKGLELHRQYQNGELKRTALPKPVYPREMPLLVERTFARRQCVECHLIGDFQNIQRERDGVLDKLTHLYRSPDIKTIGISLAVVVVEAPVARQTEHLGGGRHLFLAGRRQLVGILIGVGRTLLTAGADENVDLGATLGPPGERAPTGDLRIVGVGVDAEHARGNRIDELGHEPDCS